MMVLVSWMVFPSRKFFSKIFEETENFGLTGEQVMAIIIKQSFPGDSHLRLCWNW